MPARRPYTFAALTSLLLALCAVAAGPDVRAPSASTIQRVEILYKDGRRVVVPFDAAIQARLEAMGLDKPATQPVPPPTTGPVEPPPPVDGWTPPALPAGGRRLIVKQGDNPQQVANGLRDGDHLCFDRGGAWDVDGLKLKLSSGAVYETGDAGKPLPVLRCKRWGVIVGTPANGLTIHGLDIQATDKDRGKRWPKYRDVDLYAGIAYQQAGGRDLRIEGCRVSGFDYNILLNGVPFETSPQRLQNFRVIDCTLRDARSDYIYGAQGIYAADHDGLVLDGVLIDGAGVGNMPAAPYAHAFYGNVHAGSVAVRNSVIVGGAHYGLQLRGGYTVEGCVFYDNCHHLMGAKEGGVVRRSVFLNTHKVEADPLHLGIKGAGGDAVHAHGREVEVIDCYFAVPGRWVSCGRRGEPGWSPSTVHTTIRRGIAFGGKGVSGPVSGEPRKVSQAADFSFLPSDLAACREGRMSARALARKAVEAAGLN